MTLCGRTLPLGWETCRWQSYEPTGSPVPAAEALLRAHLEDRLAGELGDGTVLSRSFETREENGALLVTLRAVCLENIALQTETE